MVADVEDAALSLPDGKWLVGRASLQIVPADEARVEALLAVAGPVGLRPAEGERDRGDDEAGNERRPDGASIHHSG